MGTRSLTKVIEGGQIIVNMYRQFDGYPSGHGLELFGFLENILMVNGLGIHEKRTVANGAGCLAAQLVTHFKKEPGGIYLYPPAASECWQEYEYLVEVTDTSFLQVTVTNPTNVVFKGSVAAFGVFCTSKAA